MEKFRASEKKINSQMENKQLHLKYAEGRHWDNHPIEYAEYFSSLLFRQGLAGPVIDIGCSSGKDAEILQKKGHWALGLDISLDEFAKRENANYVAADAHKLPVRDASCSEISCSGFFMINVLHYLDNPQAAMSEVHRALKPGGLFYLHVNRQITDRFGNIDLAYTDSEIDKLISAFKLQQRNQFSRYDHEPIPHTHDIIELVLKKT